MTTSAFLFSSATHFPPRIFADTHLAAGHKLLHDSLLAGPTEASAEGRKNIDHTNELTMVAVMRNANLPI